MKRSIYIVLGILAVIMIALAAWWFFFRGQSGQIPSLGINGSLPQTGIQGGNGNGGSGSESGVAGAGGSGGSSTGNATGTGISTLVKDFGIAFPGPVSNYFVDGQNNILVVEPDGTIEEGANNQTSTLSSTPIENLIGTDFSYDGKKILVNFGDVNNPQSSIFDVAMKAWTPLPQGLISPKWSPSDYRIAYLSNGSTTALFTLDPTNLKKAPVRLLTLNAQDLTLRWLNGTQITLSGRPSAYAPTSIVLFDAAKNTLTPIVLGQNGAESIWSGVSSSTPALGLVFAGGGSGQSYSLSLENTSGTVLQNLNFLTLPSKCVFNIERDAASSSTTPTSTPSYPVLYCGIPRDVTTFSSAHLPDDYDQMALFTSDDLYRINATTGVATALLTDPNQTMDVVMPKMFNNIVFFINRYDQKLYALSLTL
jgi:hypothetical protein